MSDLTDDEVERLRDDSAEYEDLGIAIPPCGPDLVVRLCDEVLRLRGELATEKRRHASAREWLESDGKLHERLRVALDLTDESEETVVEATERLRAERDAATTRAEEAEVEVYAANGVLVMTNEARPGERLDDAILRLIGQRISAVWEASARGAAKERAAIADWLESGETPTANFGAEEWPDVALTVAACAKAIREGKHIGAAERGGEGERRERLQAELGMARHLLAGLSAERVIERVGLESRVRELEAELADGAEGGRDG